MTAVATRLRSLARPPEPDEWLSVEEFMAEFKLSRRTVDRWRALGTGPRFERLGGHGPLRTRRSRVNAWLNGTDAV